MAQEIINIGVVDNDPDADDIREAFRKSKSNFTELYDATQNINRINVNLINPARDAEYYFESAATVSAVMLRHGISALTVSIGGAAFIPAVAGAYIPANTDVTWRVTYSPGSVKALFYIKL